MRSQAHIRHRDAAGENSVTGIINGAYFVSCAIAAAASLNSRSRSGAGSWLTVSIGLAVLGLLRVAEAGVWTDDYLRNGLFELGWYGYRRVIQMVCIAAFALLLFAILARLPARRSTITLALLGFSGLSVFAAVRSSSLHWSDAVLSEQLGPIMVSHAIQFVLLLVTSAAAGFDCYVSGKMVRTDIA